MKSRQKLQTKVNQEIVVKLPTGLFLKEYDLIYHANSEERRGCFIRYCKIVKKAFLKRTLSLKAAAKQIAPFLYFDEISSAPEMFALIEISFRIAYTNEYIEDADVLFRAAIEKVINM